MKTKARNRVVYAVITIVLLVMAVTVKAEEFPSKPVTLIVPWAAGGVTDITLRALAESSKKYLGQPIIVENKAGGSGTLAPSTMAATAKPDGYTICQIAGTVYRYHYMTKTTYDPLKDFTYIIHIAGYLVGAVVKADSPWKTWDELVAYAKANPGKVTYATGGAGTSVHITMEKLGMEQGIKWTLYPTKGGAESLPAVLGGHVTVMIEDAVWGPHVDSGALRLLCTWGNQRTKKWPNVPTLKELHGIVSNQPWGLAGPKDMDPKVVKVLHDALKKGWEDPTFQQALEKFNMEPYYLNSEDYAKLVVDLCKTEKEMVEKLGLKR